MPHIFISYANEDRPRVAPLATALQQFGWTVWWDRKIPVGKSFDEVIEQAIDAAGCVVVVWSMQSVKSHWVKNEAEEGKHRGILVPVRIQDVKIPLSFRHLQAASLEDWKPGSTHSGFDDLVAALSALVTRTNTQSSTTDTVRRETVANFDEDAPDAEELELLLDQPVTLQALTSYTIKKFEGMSVSIGIQEQLMSSLDPKRYPTLRKVDEAVNRAKTAVGAYSSAAPGLFSHGTDFITKSLGFVDEDFRKRHQFASKTRSAFEKYGHLVARDA